MHLSGVHCISGTRDTKVNKTLPLSSSCSQPGEVATSQPFALPRDFLLQEHNLPGRLHFLEAQLLQITFFFDTCIILHYFEMHLSPFFFTTVMLALYGKYYNSVFLIDELTQPGLLWKPGLPTPGIACILSNRTKHLSRKRLVGH